MIELREYVGRRFESVDKRFNHVESYLKELRAELRDLRGRLWWIIGILITMWVTITLVALFK